MKFVHNFSFIISVSILFFLSWAPINLFNLFLYMLGITEVNKSNHLLC